MKFFYLESLRKLEQFTIVINSAESFAEYIRSIVYSGLEKRNYANLEEYTERGGVPLAFLHPFLTTSLPLYIVNFPNVSTHSLVFLIIL